MNMSFPKIKPGLNEKLESKQRVVITLTTMPDKYDKVVETLKDINKQTYKPDVIYLGIPYSSRRLKIPYPEPTLEMRKLATIVRCEDYGPVTKLSAALLEEQDPNTIIISIDDDMRYPADLIESLMEKHRLHPDAALCSAGSLVKYSCPACAINPNENYHSFRIPKFNIPDEGRKIDIIYGYAGALYKRKFFPLNSTDLVEKFFKLALINHDVLMNDDVTISAYLAHNNVERRIFANMPTVSYVTDEKNNRKRSENEISYSLIKFLKRFNVAVTTFRDLGMLTDFEDMAWEESVTGKGVLVIIAFLLIIAIIICAVFIPPEKLNYI